LIAVVVAVVIATGLKFVTTGVVVDFFLKHKLKIKELFFTEQFSCFSLAG
jgi:putative effector of murein hydrolase LrgA (UPF0299 family)